MWYIDISEKGSATYEEVGKAACAAARYEDVQQNEKENDNENV